MKFRYLSAESFWRNAVISVVAFNTWASTASAQSSDIEQLVSELISCHPQLIAARVQIESAQVSVDEIRADRLPTFSVSGDAFVNDSGSDDGQISLNVTMPLITFGRQLARERTSAAELDLAAAEYSQTTSEHIRNLIKLWIDRDALRQSLAIYDESLLAKQIFVDNISVRAERGVSSDAELREAQSEYVSDSSEIQNLRFQIMELEAEISSLSCENGQIQNVIWSALPVGVDDVHVENHPEYRVARANLLIAEREAAFAAVANNPTIQLEGRSSLDNSRDVSSRLGITARYDYESFGRGRQANVSQANLRVREAENLLRSLQMDLERQISSDFLRLSHITENLIPTLQTELNNFQETFESSQRLFNAGRMTAREVLADINSIKQSRLDMVDAHQRVSLIYNGLAYFSGLYSE